MKLRKKVRLAAIGVVLAYSIFRFGVVEATLSSYGIDPWVFLSLDLATTVTYVIGIEMLVVALVKKQDHSFTKTLGWGIMAAISFAIPYAYLFLGSREVPTSLLVGVGIIVLLLLSGAVVSVVRQVRRTK